MREPSASEYSPFEYAVVRVAPRVEREEFINAGVIVFCLARRFLAARVHVDEARLRALWPAVDIDSIAQHLESFPRICSGDASGGPIAKLGIAERFRWLTAPRSTIVQLSPVHSGLCEDPARTLDDLFGRLAEMPG